MGRCLAIPALCAALALAAGCGSSGGSSSGASSSSTTATSSGAGKTSPGTTGRGLKVTTTPKFAPATGPVRSGTINVAYRNITIAPRTLRVKVGSTIRWTNFDEVLHNVTSEGGPQKFASKDFGHGGTFAIKALEPGVINYECTIHPASMNSTIEVTG